MRISKLAAVVMAAAALALAGCSSGSKSKHGALDPFAGEGSPYYKGKKLPKGGGKRHIGKPYKVAGRWFHPKDMKSYDKKGVASWYGPQFHRRKTSNGEWFDMNELTAAHATMPLPSYVKVTNLENGREVIVRVNDRGPFVGDRIIDVSKRAAEVLEFKNRGKAKVRVQLIGPAPLKDNGSHLAAMNRELSRGTSLKRMTAKADGRLGGDEETAVAVAEPPPAAAAETSGPGDYFVQVGSFADPDNAERTREELANLGPIEVRPLEGSEGTVYNVRVGPLADAGSAQAALDEVVTSGHPDARLIVASNTL